MLNDQFGIDIFKHEVSEKQRKLVDEPVNEDLIEKNKYANNSEYIPESVYKRILNKMTNYQWSFVPHSYQEMGSDKGKYVTYIGLLIVPGFGIHTGVGSAPMNKKDNQNALSSAKTYAFKNACKEMGLAPNVGDKDYDPDELLFEEDLSEEEPPKKEKSSKEKKKKEAQKQPNKKKGVPIKDRIEEVREAYELEEDDDFVAFIQIWDEEILDLDDMEDDDWKEFLDYLEKNKDEFDEF